MTERQPDYNVFISWSGEVSNRLAHAVQDWLSTTVQASNPFVSDKNIDAGDRGLEEIGHQLDRIKTGIICLTNQNQGSAWVNYEAGALSKRVPDKTYVMCLLFDLEPGQVRYPLALFQNGPLTSDYMGMVARTVNKSLGSPLTEAKLDAMLELTWPKLATQIETIRSWNAQQVITQVEPVRTAEDMFEEVVVAIREQSSAIAELKKNRPTSRFVESQMDLLVEALSELSHSWGRTGRVTVKGLADVKDELDVDDWRIIRTAPFLVWYLEQYHNLRPRVIKESTTPVSDIDDVPF